ncbi:MAG TPA: YggU family protein [Candidatus Methanoperedenaceae archaeon]|nr:YggU family protein [Candidatus Methanoperedenaceae archaeon]
MGLSDAIRDVHDGAVIDVEVTAGAKTIAVPSGYNQWRRRIEVRLSERAEKGRANQQLISSFASLFNVSSGDVSILSGALDSRKSVKVTGMGAQEIHSILTKRMAEKNG